MVSYGFNATTFCQTVGPTDALITSSISNQQMLASATVFDDIGWYDPHSGVSDNEINARIAQKYVYAFVDQTTSEFRSHETQYGRSLDLPAALEHFYEQMHPVPGRPVLQLQRAATLEKLRGRPKDAPPFAPTFQLLEQPE